MTNAFRMMVWAFSISCVAACGGAAPEAGSPSSASTPAGPPASAPGTVDDQVAAGAKLYVENCASCHGSGGEGNAKAPAVVGKTALPLDAQPPSQARKSKFHTAADVFQFVKANMPPKSPGSLTDEQYAAIMAFDLKANGVDLGGKKVDAARAATFVLHP
jgi:mono/diheme cytochrome c family protein